MTLQAAVRDSVVLSWLGSLQTRCETAVTESRIIAGLTRLGDGLGRAGRHSQVAALGTSLHGIAEHSRCYQWLTAEPEPDVVEIDLRETMLVGPVIRTGERLGAWFSQAVAATPLSTVWHRLRQQFHERPLQVGSVLVGLLAIASLGMALAVDSSLLVGVAAILAASALLGSRIPWSDHELRETRGYQALAAAFTPPEPPETSESPAEPEEGDNETD